MQPTWTKWTRYLLNEGTPEGEGGGQASEGALPELPEGFDPNALVTQVVNGEKKTMTLQKWLSLANKGAAFDQLASTKSDLEKSLTEYKSKAEKATRIEELSAKRGELSVDEFRELATLLGAPPEAVSQATADYERKLAGEGAPPEDTAEDGGPRRTQPQALTPRQLRAMATTEAWAESLKERGIEPEEIEAAIGYVRKQQNASLKELAFNHLTEVPGLDRILKGKEGRDIFEEDLWPSLEGRGRGAKLTREVIAAEGQKFLKRLERLGRASGIPTSLAGPSRGGSIPGSSGGMTGLYPPSKKPDYKDYPADRKHEFMPDFLEWHKYQESIGAAAE